MSENVHKQYTNVKEKKQQVIIDSSENKVVCCIKANFRQAKESVIRISPGNKRSRNKYIFTHKQSHTSSEGVEQ
jgi:hypothetical protein